MCTLLLVVGVLLTVGPVVSVVLVSVLCEVWTLFVNLED